MTLLLEDNPKGPSTNALFTNPLSNFYSIASIYRRILPIARLTAVAQQICEISGLGYRVYNTFRCGPVAR